MHGTNPLAVQLANVLSELAPDMTAADGASAGRSSSNAAVPR